MRKRGITWAAVAFVAAAVVAGMLLERLRDARAPGDGFGYVANPAGTREFLATLEHPTFGDAAPRVVEAAKGRDTLLYRHADRAHRAVYGRPFEVWNQGSHGACVAFGWAMGSYVGQAVDWTEGERADPPRLVATEPIYGGSRTAGRLPPVEFAGWSDGSYGAAAARWVVGTKAGVGGIHFRQKYGDVDLSSYSIERSRNWGAYGVPKDIAREGLKHTAVNVALCEDYDALCAAIENGLCVPICSNVGFASTNVRDADGFLPRGGSWAHCMVAIGVRYAAGPGKRDGVLICNSWGPAWVKGGRWPDDMPDGCFWADRKAVESMLAQGDSFVIAGVNGFEPREIDNGEWFQPAPPAPPQNPQPARVIAGAYSLAP